MKNIVKKINSFLINAKSICSNKRGNELVTVIVVILIVVVIAVVVFFPQMTDLFTNVFNGVNEKIDTINNYKG